MEWLQACHLLTVGLLVFITADKNLEIGGDMTLSCHISAIHLFIVKSY